MSARARRLPVLVLRLCAALLVLPALMGPGLARVPSAAAASAVDAKIAPWVLAHAAGTPVEFLVILAEQADLSGADALPTKAEKGRYVVEQLRAVAQASQGGVRAALEAEGVPYRVYYIVNALWVKGDVALARTLAARPDVAQIDGNPALQADLGGPDLSLPEGDNAALPIGPQSRAEATATQAVTPADFSFKIRLPLVQKAIAATEASLRYVNADDVWAKGYIGQGIVVGAQDTGYDWDHPALKNQYRGWDGTTADHDYNWHDSIHSGGGSCGHDSPEPCDDGTHGTHTLGTAVGSDGNTNRIGMAPGARWIGCRNMDQGVGSPATYLECFEFFLAPYPVGGDPLDGNPDLAPDVTNNSWACPEFPEGCSTTSLLAAVEAQRAAGILTVVSAGNAGPGCSTVVDPPAIHAAVYSIGALNTGADTIAGFSSRGAVTVDGSQRRKPDLSAPGTNIRSSVPGGDYAGGYSGTSMAAPHVTGAVALLWSAVPSLRGQIGETEQVLNDSAVHINSNACGSAGSPNNTYGYGRLNVEAAVNLALQLYGVQADALPMPVSLYELFDIFSGRSPQPY
jgi:serine protease AprX